MAKLLQATLSPHRISWEGQRTMAVLHRKMPRPPVPRPVVQDPCSEFRLRPNRSPSMPCGDEHAERAVQRVCGRGPSSAISREWPHGVGQCGEGFDRAAIELGWRCSSRRSAQEAGVVDARPAPTGAVIEETQPDLLTVSPTETHRRAGSAAKAYATPNAGKKPGRPPFGPMMSQRTPACRRAQRRRPVFVPFQGRR